MTKLLVVSILVTLFLSSCACHNYGFKAGLNMSSINGKDVDNTDARIGGFFGGFGEFCIDDSFAIQPELLYSLQGTKDMKLDYLILPIMAKAKITEDFIAEAGPQIGYLVSGESAADTFQDLDYGVNFGLEYQINDNFNIGTRYNLGLSNIYSKDFLGDFDAKNGVLQLSVGYRF